MTQFLKQYCKQRLRISQVHLAIDLMGVESIDLYREVMNSIKAGKKIRPYAKDYPYRLAFLLGLCVAVLGVISNGQVYGTGYIEAQQMRIKEK